jgi:hypothetical protein
MSHPRLWSYKPQVKSCHECGSKEGYSIHRRCLVCLTKYGSGAFFHLPATETKPKAETIDYDRFMRQRPHRVRRSRGW